MFLPKCVFVIEQGGLLSFLPVPSPHNRTSSAGVLNAVPDPMSGHSTGPVIQPTHSLSLRLLTAVFARLSVLLGLFDKDLGGGGGCVLVEEVE